MTRLSWNLDVSSTGLLISGLVSVFSLRGNLDIAGSGFVDGLLYVTRLFNVAGLLEDGLIVGGLLDVARLLVARLLITRLLVARLLVARLIVARLFVARLSEPGLLNDVASGTDGRLTIVRLAGIVGRLPVVGVIN